ncbi:uncharacterized protein LOC107001078 [Solanum pennellii]|uniref:Uncharacterized protein LOC107001078 n=1 Tax=Solanum pennellii TaxID=28526 RepID=A0ABM1FC80_SOLPN|nr:uncharacterized protein LOC107001078 [Solanum pennellii]
MGAFLSHDLRKARIREFLTLKQEFMSVHKYNLKFTQLFHFAPEIVADMRIQMSLFVVGLSCLSSKDGKATMLIGDMDIARLMIHVHQVEKDKLRDREVFKNKKDKTTGNKSEQEKNNANCSSFQHKQNGPAPSFSSAPSPSNKYRAVPRGTTLGTDKGSNRLYSITSRQEEENSPDVFTGMIKVFTFDAYDLLDV